MTAPHPRAPRDSGVRERLARLVDRLPRPMRRWVLRIGVRMPMVAWLTVMWLILWGDVTLGATVAGAIVATGCYAAAKLPRMPIGVRLRPLGIVRVVVVLAYDLLVSSVHMAWHVLHRPGRARGAVVAVPLQTESDLLMAMTAGGLTMVPGSMVVGLNRDEGVLYVHGFPLHDERSVEKLRRDVRRTEELFVRAFGTAADIAGLNGGTPERVPAPGGRGADGGEG
ncbi:Na+/H+ antiporter subunit E [Allonocardiopsis opalescens]|uniref:Multisubunit sodium/proton antiporter MrpE subunit n=1 Tax=Allonocardiopsis opalescens TaxID=1144618 RepID=A0A2T0Q0M3_9ACTN|nr:Na+/H+ antiporter subunit E [Allonocardiopsis opalescens]PRX97338.1 multisubunit sodium/proton antiporter MrpE subunit [Allonocardiopsis opalescens]